jgi:hypothetical protein
MSIPENNSYAKTLQQVNSHWEKDTLHLYELSASGELRPKEGTAWLMAKINHALGLTPKNEKDLMSFYERSNGQDGRAAEIIRKAIALEDALLVLKARAKKTNEQFLTNCL